MVLGIGSFAFGWSIGTKDSMPQTPFNELDLLKFAKVHNIKGLQLGDNLPVHTFDQQREDNLKNEIQAQGISPELGARGLTDKHLNTYLKLSTFYQSSLLRFVIDEGDYQPKLDSVIDIIKDFIPILEKENITLGIENHDRFKAMELANMMDRLSSDKIGICLDCVNSLGAGEGLEHVVEVLAPYTVNLHIKDFTIERAHHSMGFNISGTPAGKGMAHISFVLEEIMKFNRCQSAILEQWVPYQENLSATIALEKKWAVESIQYLKMIPLFGNV
jgi:3-oxoisoapionate decarboxylase